MKPKKIEVKTYYSGFCTYQIEAKNEIEAITKARNRQIDSVELLSNLENWKEADTAELNLENLQHRNNCFILGRIPVITLIGQNRIKVKRAKSRKHSSNH